MTHGTSSVFTKPRVALWVGRIVYGVAIALFGLACFALGEVWGDTSLWAQGTAMALESPVVFLFGAIILMWSYEQRLAWHVVMAVSAPVAAIVFFSTDIGGDPASTWVYGGTASLLAVLSLLSIGAALAQGKGAADQG